jgi:hypothetical protein
MAGGTFLVPFGDRQVPLHRFFRYQSGIPVGAAFLTPDLAIHFETSVEVHGELMVGVGNQRRPVVLVLERLV